MARALLKASRSIEPSNAYNVRKIVEEEKYGRTERFARARLSKHIDTRSHFCTVRLNGNLRFLSLSLSLTSPASERCAPASFHREAHVHFATAHVDASMLVSHTTIFYIKWKLYLPDEIPGIYIYIYIPDGSLYIHTRGCVDECLLFCSLPGLFVWVSYNSVDILTAY